MRLCFHCCWDKAQSFPIKDPGVLWSIAGKGYDLVQAIPYQRQQRPHLTNLTRTSAS